MKTEIILVLGLLIVAAAWWGFLRWRRLQELRRRLLVEDALKYLLEQEIDGQPATLEALAGALSLLHGRALHLVADMEARNLLQTRGAALMLTNEGRQWATHVLRAHRLWERYLADEARVPLHRIHGEAHRWEHNATPESLDRLEAHLGHPRHDPHGDPIPAKNALPPRPRGIPLTDWDEGQRGVITHLEDEPADAYKRILAEGLWLGQHVAVQSHTAQDVQFSDGQRTYHLPPAVAANVFLSPTEGEAAAALPPDVQPLSAWPDGKPAQVVDIAPWMQGFTRRRLMDLGVTPGAEIVPVLRPFFGDPRAYRVRGTTIALRRDQAAAILVRPVNADAHPVAASADQNKATDQQPIAE